MRPVRGGAAPVDRTGADQVSDRCAPDVHQPGERPGGEEQAGARRVRPEEQRGVGDHLRPGPEREQAAEPDRHRAPVVVSAAGGSASTSRRVPRAPVSRRPGTGGRGHAGRGRPSGSGRSGTVRHAGLPRRGGCPPRRGPPARPARPARGARGGRRGGPRTGWCQRYRSGSIRAVTADGRRGTARRDGRPDGPGPPLVRPPLAVPFGGTPGAVDPSVPSAGRDTKGRSVPARAGRPWFAPGAQPAPVPWPPRTATARGRSPTGSRVTRPVATSTALRPFQ